MLWGYGHCDVLTTSEMAYSSTEEDTDEYFHIREDLTSQGSASNLEDVAVEIAREAILLSEYAERKTVKAEGVQRLVKPVYLSNQI